MPTLVEIAIAPPPHEISQSAAAAFARGAFGGKRSDLERLMPVFDNAGIRTRRIAQPPAWYAEEHGLPERNSVYIEAATELCARAVREVLDRAALDAADVDRILYVNTTGLATPSIDARLINMCGLSSHVRRTPIWGLGCAGGVAGLSHAFHHAAGHPHERVLLVAAEFCSLTLLLDDASISNVVATALFADGAAAAIVSGDATGDGGYPIIDARSTLYPDSLHVMGWNVVSRGLQVVFDRRIPQIVKKHARDELDELLARHDLDRTSVTEWLYHPGGPKVLQAYADAYGVPLEAFGWSRDVLRDFGNMSSVTVLYVLERYLRAHPPGRGGRAVISALGPGFSSETLLMEV